MKVKNIFALLALVSMALFAGGAHADMVLCGVIFPINGFDGDTVASTEYSFISLGGSSVDMTPSRIIVKNNASSSQFVSASYYWSNLGTFTLSFDYSFSGTPTDSWVKVSDSEGLIEETFSGSGGNFMYTFIPGDIVTLTASAQRYNTATIDHITTDPPAHTPLPGTLALLGTGLLGLGLLRRRFFG